MSIGNEKLSEKLAIVSKLDPKSQSAATVTSDYVDMAKIKKVIFILQTGALGTSATVDMAIKGDTTSGGSYTTTITGKSITQLVKASNDNNIAVVEVSAAEVAAQGFRYIRASVTVGTAASLISLVALAGTLLYSSANENDLAAVVEIVA